MRAYQRKRGLLAAAVLAAALMIMPSCVMAAETAPMVPNTQTMHRTGEQLRPFGKVKAYRGVSVSREWLRQAKLGGVFLNLRLHTPTGGEVVFKEKLGSASFDADRTCLYLQASEPCQTVMLQLDQDAVNALERMGIVEIVIADRDLFVRASYLVDELAAVRRALGLADGEQLCVSGEDAPVTVVNEDGVRRKVN